jgi:hypothetical protein
MTTRCTAAGLVVLGAVSLLAVVGALPAGHLLQKRTQTRYLDGETVVVETVSAPQPTRPNPIKTKLVYRRAGGVSTIAVNLK